MDNSLITYPSWERYTVLSNVVLSLSVKERRHIFTLARSRTPASPDLFFPHFGFTLAEFAVWYTIGELKSKKKRDAKG
mgnify:CR=1 FL=1